MNLRESLRDAIHSLPERERSVVLRTYLVGEKQADIAADMGISQPAVGKILASAKKISARF
jgi:RNA polymerase sigma factor (sigma-70 family)